MKNLKSTQKFALITIILICLLVPFLYWYDQVYLMEINSITTDQKLLIAKQSSPFKDSVTAVISDHYKSALVVVDIIDVSALEHTDISEFDAILIIYRWEARAPIAIVQIFMDKNSGLKNKMVILTTSWNGLEKMKNVDAITGASMIDDVPIFTNKIIRRLNLLLKSKN